MSYACEWVRHTKAGAVKCTKSVTAAVICAERQEGRECRLVLKGVCEEHAGHARVVGLLTMSIDAVCVEVESAESGAEAGGASGENT